MAMNKTCLYFWQYMQKELEARGLSAGIAVLNYSMSLLRSLPCRELNVNSNSYIPQWTIPYRLI